MAHVVVITPVYKHSRLVVDPIKSVLSQVFSGIVSHILVSDGCPFDETHMTLKEFSNAYPSRIYYIKKSNGGLSSARNFGIDFALSCWPDLDAIYFLDADNLLTPYSIHRFYTALVSSRDSLSWVYPDIDMIGVPWNSHYGGPYSSYVHARTNMCEAGSMISANIAKRGLRFDETFKKGWEDWEFWLSCNQAGATGINLRASGFKYRKRPESMLAVSDRDPSTLFNQIHDKHPRLQQPRHLIELEALHNARYSIITSDFDVYLCTDPRQLRRFSMLSLERMFYKSLAPTYAAYFPGFVVFTDSQLLYILKSNLLVNYVFFELESCLDKAPIACIDVYASSEDAFHVNPPNDSDDHLFLGQITMIQSTLMAEIIKDVSMDWIENQLSTRENILTRKIVLSRPESSLMHSPTYLDVIQMPLAAIRRMRSSSFKDCWLSCCATTGQIPVDGLANYRMQSHIISREKLKCSPVSNILPSKTDVAFIIPIIEFGGVEKVLINTAIEFTKRGISCHLFVSGTNGAEAGIYLHDEIRLHFKTINFLSDDDFFIWSRTGYPDFYYGTCVPDWPKSHTGPSKAIGMLSSMQLVINYHVSDFSGIMGRLRTLGVKTACSLHVIDQTVLGLGVGNIYNCLAFEHAYDLFLPCSTSLSLYLSSLGIPADKICSVVNSSSIAASKMILPSHQITCARKEYHATNSVLRFLYLGRLDFQKGLSLLIQAINGLHLHFGAKVSVKIVGGSVVQNEGSYNPIEALDCCPEIELLPPVYDQEALSELLFNSDFLLLTSRYEGLPLVLIEAMQHGVIPVTTNVGAISDLIITGENGYCFESSCFVDSLISLISTCITDNKLIDRLSEEAIRTASGHSWSDAVNPLLARVKRLLGVDQESIDDKPA